MALLGLDIGSSGCKSIIYSENGTLLSSSYREYDIKRIEGTHELDTDVIWSSVQTVIRDSVIKCSETVTALSVASFGESAVHIDKKGNSLCPVMLYTDPRGKVECNELTKRISKDEISDYCGVSPHSMYTIPKVMWRMKNQKEIIKNTYKILLIEDFIIFKLTGNFFIDYSLASRTMGFDIRQKCWNQNIFDAAEINSGLFSVPVPSGTDTGTVLPDRASRLGLSNNVRVVTGGHDQICASVGTGAVYPGISTDGIGTVECITPVFDHPITGSSMQNFGYACVPHVIDGLYATYAFSSSGGAAVKWFRDAFGMKYMNEAKQSRLNIYKYLDSLVSENPSGLLVLPHFAGAATPYMNNNAHSAVLGMTLGTDAIQLYRGILEGVTYEILINIEHLKKAGIKIEKLHAAGGGACSKIWLQIKADILNIPIYSVKNPESGTAGAAMLAGIGTGIYKDLPEAVKTFVKTGEIFEPRSKMHEIYNEFFSKYRLIYKAVKSVYKN